ncbi:PAS domain-containing protein [Methylobacterium radiotolerans]|uniref:PAS domain-containing protein n=1 Tax=Methylobacterium TaxID=407 RepID=UPI0005E0B2AF|nr:MULTISPECIES: PAS domain-containing protein [Methylobacterium]MCY4509012.1 PAS domain-containing protein [Acidobacteriota bacterium]GAN49116.1 hypothetical protein ME121_3138 [Methylobacterium sp. ME121]KZC01126.1 hypothetical protein AU375_02596 [Methylobacterium radiotolerans]MBN6819218.1 PAS domain-containing protein [Methylobacterium organophilum]OXE40588.1 diguanylate cyclase [Methylobacterium radiotolerans]
MIFVTDARGRCVYACPEWEALTGQPSTEALGRGWVLRVHPDDRGTATGILDEALASGAEFSIRYRLLKPDDTPRWVGAGGVPSFGIENGAFIGYLGSITELARGGTDTIAAYGNVGRFVPPPPHPATMPIDTLDLIADHLIITHSLIEEDDGAKAALPGVRIALLEVGLALAARMRMQSRSLN